MSTTAIAAPAIIVAVENGVRSEISDLVAFRAENENADKIFEGLLLDGTASNANTEYLLLDAQALIQRMA